MTIRIDEAEPVGIRALRGGEPLPLSEPRQAWALLEGEASVFFVRPDGARRFVCTLGAGALALGFAPGGVGVLLVPQEAARVQPLALDALAESLVNDATARDWLASWLASLQQAWPRTAPAGELVAGAGKVALRRGTWLQSSESLVWCEVLEGAPHWHGLGEHALAVGDRVPLAPGLALAAADEAGCQLAPSEALAPAALAEALLAMQARVLAALELRDHEEARDRRGRFDRRLAFEQDRLRATMSGLTRVVTRGATVGASETDALLEAVRLVGRNAGIVVRPPARSEDMSRVAEPIDAVARASRFRTRTVLLMPPWWERDNGPLLGYRRGTRAPVALLPDGKGYQLVDPSTGATTRVDAAIARTLEPRAVMIYGALPEGKPSVFKLLAFATRGNYRDIALVAVMGIVGSLLGMVVPQVTGMLVDNAIPDSDRLLVLEMGLGLMATAVGKAVFTVCQGVLLQRVEARADASTQAGVWDRVLNLGAPFFRRYEIGDLVSRVMAISAIRQSLSGQVLGSALSAVFALLNLGLMLQYSPPLAAVAVGITALSVSITAALSVVRIRRAQPLRDLEGTLQGTVIQLINGVAKLRTAGAEGRAFAHWATYFQRRTGLRKQLQDLDNLMTLINQALPLLSSMAIFYVAATSLGLEVEGNPGGLSTGIFLAFNAAAGTFMGGISQLAGVLVSQLNLSINWQRALPVLEEPPEVGAEQIDPGRLSGRIALERVTFRYEPESRAILDDVSLTIEPGEHVALVGPSGCGKSTIFRLLLGFETPESGIVAFDQQDLRTLDPRAVRRQLGVVLQSGRLASGSVYDNVAAGALLSQEEIWEAIRGAGMEEDIRRMPMGLHTVVSEGGSNLSGGQRQRLLIARALAQRPRIVLFDEATSALDNETQAIVSATLDRLRATRVVIAHRLSTIRQADKIVVMDAGRVLQVGSFDQLAREEGLFARLVERQSV